MISALQQLQLLLQQFNRMYLRTFVFTNKRLFLQNTWKGLEGRRAAVAGVAAEGVDAAGAAAGVVEEDGEKLLFLITINSYLLLFINCY